MNAPHIHYCPFYLMEWTSSTAANNMIFVYNLPAAISLESDLDLIDE